MIRRLLLSSLIVAIAFPAIAQEQKSEAAPKKGTEQTSKPEPIKTRTLLIEKKAQAFKQELKVPVTWTDVKNASRMRSATLAIPAAKGDKEKGELSVFVFPGQAVDDNLKRWIGQFQSKERKQKLLTGMIKGAKQDTPAGRYYLLEVSGTFKKPIGPPMMRKSTDAPGYRMLAVLLRTPRAVLVLKMTGPDKTVAAQLKALRASFGGDVKTEKPYKMKS
jgi:gluconolactonase